MPMVCPKCNNSYEAQVECPICRVRLTVRDPRSHAGIGPAAPSDSWQQTPWARLLGGILVAQGLYFGVGHAFQAAHKAFGLPFEPGSLNYLLQQQAAQGLGLLLGGILAGAGQRRGLIFGALVGLLNSVIFLGFLLLPPDVVGRLGWPATEDIAGVTLFAQPILQTAVGTLGGFLSSLIWKPVEPLEIAAQQPLLPPRPPVVVRSAPLAWGRILAGMALAVGGTVWANLILEFLQRPGERPGEQSLLKLETRQQEQLVTWEIFAVAMVAGSSLAGATTGSGLKQGVCVGLGTGAILLGIYLGIYMNRSQSQRDRGSPQTLLLRVLDVHPFGRDAAGDTMSAIVFTVAFTLGLGMLGGWFGSQLFPPVSPKASSSRHGTRTPAFRA
jgi:hypothetical protein